MLTRHFPMYSHGLTLTEILIVLTLSSILLAIGAPALAQWVRDIEVRSNASSLLAVLHAARTEALTRNAWVRLQLRDTQGRPGWQLGCVQPTARCPSLIRQQATDQGTAVRWGAALLSAMPPIHTAIAAGANFPAAIRFDATGAAPNIATGDDIARIDITYNGEPTTRRMVVMVSAQGMVRLCDASVSNTHPMFCN
jgi:type IV fimbrial biogenesis protein FimT